MTWVSDPVGESDCDPIVQVWFERLRDTRSETWWDRADFEGSGIVILPCLALPSFVNRRTRPCQATPVGSLTVGRWLGALAFFAVLAQLSHNGRLRQPVRTPSRDSPLRFGPQLLTPPTT